MTAQREQPDVEREERVVVVDRLAAVRSALFLLLSRQPDMTIVGDRGDIDDLAEYLAEVQATILLLDWTLIGRESASLMPRIRASCPELFIVALSARPEHYSEALAAGANAFICKGDEPASLLDTLNEAATSRQSLR